MANAPVSYGAFELTVGIDPQTPDGEHVLDEVAGGLRGHRSGSGRLPGVGAANSATGWPSAGWAWPAATWSSPTPTRPRWSEVLPELDAMLDTFDAVSG